MSKRALVTGAGRGIGRAIAERLAADGHRLVLVGRASVELDAVAAQTGGQILHADLAERGAVEALVAALAPGDPIDVLVNNAGIADSAPLGRTSDELWDRMLEINVTQPFRLCRALVPGMAARGFGRVINIASTAGVTGYAYTAAYCASKHALVGLTRALAVDFAAAGVTVNAVCPGWVKTRITEEATARIASKTGRSVEDAEATLAQMSPQRRLMEPAEIANLVAMLASEASRGINGQTLVVDGGGVMR